MPEKPVVTVASLHTQLGLIVAKLGCLTGLTVIEVDRWVEHSAGKSLRAIVRDRGPATLQALRLVSLDRPIANKPPAITALDDDFARAVGTADLREDRATFELQCEDSTRNLDGVRSPVAVVVQAALKSVRNVHARWLPRRGGSRTDCRQVIRVDGKHVWTTANEIMRQLCVCLITRSFMREGKQTRRATPSVHVEQPVDHASETSDEHSNHSA